MAAISHTNLWNAFSWMKLLELRLIFHWSFFLTVKLTIFQLWIRWWLGADQATSHYLNQWWSNYRRIYASFGLKELNPYNRHLITSPWTPIYVLLQPLQCSMIWHVVLDHVITVPEWIVVTIFFYQVEFTEYIFKHWGWHWKCRFSAKWSLCSGPVCWNKAYLNNVLYNRK